MNDVLDDLNRSVGIKGSMVVTPDGVVAAARFGHGLDDDRVAAIASILIPTVRRSLQRAGLRPFSKCILTASEGRLVIVDTGRVFLVVATDAGIRLDVTLLDIDAAARRIDGRSRLEVPGAVRA